MSKKSASKQHVTFFRATLYTALGMLAVSVFIDILLILLTNLDSLSFIYVFDVTRQIFWFGALSLALAELHDKNTAFIPRIVAIIGVMICAFLLLIGAGLSIEIIPTTFHVSALQDALNVVLYSAIFIGVQGIAISKPSIPVKIAQNVIIGAIGLFDLITIMLIYIYAPLGRTMMPRFFLVLFILAITDVITMAIINTLHKTPTAPTKKSKK